MTAPDAPLDRLLEHRPWVRSLVRSIVFDAARADDVEQQVWLTAVRHGGGDIETPRAWLATVARNWARKLHRGASRTARREAAAARPEVVDVDDDPVERAEAHREVVDEVLALPEPLRLAVLRHYFDGLSVADVATRLDVPRETVRSRLRLARGRLRERLGPKDTALAWSPALLALGGIPRDFAVGASTTTVTGGAIAMTAAQKLAFALVVPVAVGAAWVTTRAAAPSPDDARAADVARLEERLDRIEKSVAAAKPARAVDDRGLARRVEALETRLDEAARAPATAAVATKTPAASAAPATSNEDPGARAAKGETKRDHDDIADALKKTKPGSPEHLAALRLLADWLVKSAGPPAVDKEVAWAQDLFDAEARAERVAPTEAAELVRILDGLPPGNAARAGIAAGVAGGWAVDPRLADFLARFPTNSEPQVHWEMLVLLDHHPSAAFGDYVMRLVREERNAGVLESAFRRDRVVAVATTAESALRFAQAVDARMQDGSLDAKLRPRAACAVAVAGLRAPEPCAELLGRIAARESDARLAQSCRDAASALTDKSATVKTLETMFR
jgi:RNA polymerase sigma-70 factor (ECF subfamily)